MEKPIRWGAEDASAEPVLIYAPFGRDAEVMREMLAGRGVAALVCHTADQFCANLATGAAAAIATIEALAGGDLDRLAKILAAQPPWSDLPFIVLFNKRDAAVSQKLLLETLGKVGNLNLLERPLRIEALLNAVALSLRARQRQYQAREHMRELEEAKHSLAKATDEAVRANEGKSRFLAAASHDLRQPFQAMRLYHAIVADALQGTPAHRAAVGLGDAITSGEDLLNALLDLSTLDAGVTKVQISDFDLGQVLHTVTNDLGAIAQGKGLALRVRPAPRVIVRSDEVLLKRMIRNLTMNAIRYTERGKILVCCRARPDHVLVQVWDTGIGIPADKANQIFEDFYQVGNVERDSSKGMGLGLSIVDRMARLLDHKITVQSVYGRGSVFTVKVARVSSPQSADRRG
jgi:signal transduction histidine kinase